MPVITFKVSDDEAREIRARAAKALSVSDYLRKSALGSESKASKVIRRRHPISGLPYNASAGRSVSDAEIRTALADFP